MPPQESSNGSSNKGAVILVSVLVLLLIGIFFFKSGEKTEQPIVENETPTTNTENVQNETVNIERVDLSQAQTGADKLPKGFPALIPVETSDVFASDSQIYTDRTPNIVVYTVNYRTDKSVSEKYNEYLDYMTKSSFEFGANGKDEKNHVLAGTKSGNSLQVVISGSGGKTIVQIAYTEVR